MTRWKWRWLSHAYATLFGYFWLPCPVCGRDFGGHEMSGAFLPDAVDPSAGWGVCADPACVQTAHAAQAARPQPIRIKYL